MRFIKKLFTKKVNPTQETEPIVQCGECSLSQQQYPHAPFFSDCAERSKVLCESCYEKKISSEECSCITYNEEKGEWEEAPECWGDCPESEEIYMYLNYWSRMQRPKIDYSEESQVWGFIIEHPRMGYDRVYFGPFRTRDEVSEWMEKVGRPHRVSGAVYPIMNPHGDPEDFWYIPNDMPWDETLKPKKDREYIP